MTNRKPLMLESMLLDVANPDEMGTFYRLMDERKKGPAVCYGMRILRKYWAELVNSRYAEKAQNVQESLPVHARSDFFIPKITLA